MMFWVFVVLVFILDIGTGILVAIRSKALKTKYILKPSVILGDMIIIPLIGRYILNYFLVTNKNLLDLFSDTFLTLIGFVAISSAILSGIRFKTINPWYYPHSVFYAFMAFWILLFLIGVYDIKSIYWWAVIFGVGTHFYLGKKFPKVFPKIN